MRALAEQIAVLDGIDTSTIGVMPGVTQRRNVIDPSGGANYSGGSDYAPGLPLLTSSIGLAAAPLPGTLPPKRNVIDPSGGANYSGGSSYAPGVPLLPSTVGLAAAFGNAGGNYVDQDLAGAFNGFEAAKTIMPGVTQRRNVIDPSEGANYSGGSDYAPGLPLLTSTIGLAGLDSLADSVFLRKLSPAARGLFAKGASKKVVSNLVSKVRAARQRATKAPSPMARAQAARNFANMAAALTRVRMARKAILERNTVNGVPVVASRPISPSTLNGMIVDGVPVSASSTYSPTTFWK
jgi:hypothetical protein